MIISDLAKIDGRTYPARRRTQNLVGGPAPVQATNFSAGYVTLEPKGGQVPWHNQEQEEVYLVLEGTGEMCLGTERRTVTGGQAVWIPPGEFHQLTNIGQVQARPRTAPMRFFPWLPTMRHHGRCGLAMKVRWLVLPATPWSLNVRRCPTTGSKSLPARRQRGACAISTAPSPDCRRWPPAVH